MVTRAVAGWYGYMCYVINVARLIMYECELEAKLSALFALVTKYNQISYLLTGY